MVDPYKNETEVRARLRSRIENETKGNVTAWAELNGFLKCTINDVLWGRRHVSYRLAQYLGYTRTVIYLEQDVGVNNESRRT